MNVDKNVLENLLRANGVSTSSPDEEIKSILLSAKWHEDDVDMALLVLRSNKVTNKQRVEAVYDGDFRLQDRLKPETISALLGVNVDIDITEQERDRHTKSGRLSAWGVMGIMTASIFLAMFCLIGLMWVFRIGIFGVL